MSTMNNTMILEDAQADFDTALSQRNWNDARAIIDNLGDTGFAHEARILHQAYNRAWAHWSNEQDDLALGHADPRDVADRSYPNE
jgi:hypothetical protein